MPWRRFQDAITHRDGECFRTLAVRAPQEAHRNLLLLFADIIDSGLPIDASDLVGPARLVARLVYDSFRDPLPAGTRMQHCIRRHALYTAGRYSVDVELEHERGSARVALVGQIADRHEPQNTLGEIPIVVMSGDAVVARAQSNRFGEFQLEYELAQQLKLYFPLAQQGTRIEVRLVGLR